MDDELEAKKSPRGLKGGVYTEDSGLPPPKDIDSGSAPPKPKSSKPKQMAGGGYVKAADGCAQRGKTRGKMV